LQYFLEQNKVDFVFSKLMKDISENDRECAVANSAEYLGSKSGWNLAVVDKFADLT